MPISSLELKEFSNTTFVECGSASGDGIQAALTAGFKEIHSIEINPHNYKECVKRFSNNNNIHLYLGDCGELLETILNQINKPCLSYLDANGWRGETRSPYHSSIDAIVRHGRKDHTILVDDLNHDYNPTWKVIKDLRTSKNGKNDQDVIRQLLRVNSDYYFYVIDTHSEDSLRVYPSWVLVATTDNNKDVEYI